MSDDKDDSKWTGDYGDCKICHGEIPHGHTETCYIHKMQARDKKVRTVLQIAYEAAEHCLIATADPAKYGQFLSRQSRDILREALTALTELIKEMEK